MTDLIVTRVEVDEARIERHITNEVRRQVGAWLRALQGQFLQEFHSPKSGNPGKYRQASAPGEAPAEQSGRLIGSMRAYMRGLDGFFEIGAFYGPLLDEGTTRIAPRPFVDEAVEGFLELQASGVLDTPKGVL